MDITLKNIPDSVYRVIRREAKRERRSLNAQIIHTLETEAAAVARHERLKSLRKEFDRFAASIPAMEDSTPLIRRERRR